MTQDIHEAARLEVRPNEDHRYGLDTTKNGDSPTVNTVTIYSVADFASDLSLTHFSGAPDTVGNIITSPLVQNLVDGETYRIVYNYTLLGNTYEDYITLVCTTNQ